MLIQMNKDNTIALAHMVTKYEPNTNPSKNTGGCVYVIGLTGRKQGSSCATPKVDFIPAAIQYTAKL